MCPVHLELVTVCNIPSHPVPIINHHWVNVCMGVTGKKVSSGCVENRRWKDLDRRACLTQRGRAIAIVVTFEISSSSVCVVVIDTRFGFRLLGL